MNAIILAGGRGSRLVPWHAPKCLLPINGVSMLHRILDHVFPHTTVGSVVTICTGYRHGDVEAALKSWGAKDKIIKFSNAGEDATMGQRLLKARDTGERVLICYGDELADVDLVALLKKHEGAKATFAMTAAVIPGGSVTLYEVGLDDQGQPVIHENEKRWVNIGFAVMEAECWELLKPEDGLSDWINRVAEKYPVHVFEHKGKRATVNSLADLEHAQEVWK